MLSLPYGTECNAFCNFCLKQISPNNIPKTVSIPHVFSIMEDFIKKSSSIYFSDWGEPGVAPFFKWSIKKLKDFISPDVTIGFATNGININNSMFDFLYDGQPHFIIISLNSTNKHKYRKTMGIDCYETVISNVKYLISKRKLKRKLLTNPNLLTVYLSIVITPQNINDLIDFINIAHELEVQGVLIEEFIDFNQVSNQYAMSNSLKEIYQIYLKSLSFANKCNIPLVTVSNSWYLNPRRKSTETFWCEEPWRSFRVGSDGEVFPCCYLRKSCGNVFDSNPEDIWYGDIYKSLRRQWIDGNQKNACLECKNRWTSRI